MYKCGMVWIYPHHRYDYTYFVEDLPAFVLQQRIWEQLRHNRERRRGPPSLAQAWLSCFSARWVGAPRCLETLERRYKKVYIELRLNDHTKWDAIGEVEKVGGKELEQVDHVLLLNIWAGSWQVVHRLVLAGMPSRTWFPIPHLLWEVISPAPPLSGHTHLPQYSFTLQSAVMNDSISFVVLYETSSFQSGLSD